LGVSRSASEQEIVHAYKTLVGRYHPDRHQGNELEDLAREKLASLNEAYETLSDEVKKAAYDTRYRSSRKVGSSPFPGPEKESPGTPYIRRLVFLLLISSLVFFSLRFLRNPRVFAMLGIFIAIIWFGPRLFRWLSNKKKP
jgi:curved DNA-binding protein CbpA